MHPFVLSFLLEEKMKRVLIVCVIVFIVLSVVLYFYDMYMFSVMRKNKKNKKNKEKYLFSVRYLMAKFKLSKELLIQNKMAFIYSLIDAFIITIVFMIIELINLPFYIQILIGFVLLFGLIYAMYELLGRYLERKENNERV